MTVRLAKVLNVSADRLEDAEAEEAKQAHEGEVEGVV